MIQQLDVASSAYGHLTLTWDTDDPDESGKAREMVADLRAKGYAFFAVIEDNLAPRRGALVVERIDTPLIEAAPERLSLSAPTSEPAANPEATAPTAEETPKRRGRPARTVAVPRARGG